MFYYFGRKARLAHLYPAPLYDTVIEPFAGSMAYTLHHRPGEAVGTELDERTHEAWAKVVGMTAAELLAYPEPRIGQVVTDRWSMMAAGSHGTTRAESYIWTDRMARDIAKQKRMAARHADYAPRVNYMNLPYTEVPNFEATYFVDPPYQHVRRGYRYRDIDYAELAEWCRTRKGQVIVCEQAGADWLPFVPLATIQGTTNKRTTEVVWIGGQG